MIGLTQLPQNRRKQALIVAGLLLAYIIFGFLLLPRLIHNTLTETLAAASHRHVTLAELKINPLTLSATLRSLKIGTAEQPLANFDEIYINFSFSSLWRVAYVFDAVRLQSPRVVIAIDREGRFNFQDMMPASDTKPSGPLPIVEIQSLEVLRGAIDFYDLTQPTPFRTNIATLDFTLRDFTTRRDVAGNYHLHAATDLGETLDWRGSLQATPFRSEGTLRLGGIRAETIWMLAGADFKFDLKRGLIDLNARYLIDLGGAKPQFRLDNMNVALRDLQLLRRSETESVLTFPHLDVSGAKLDWQRRTIAISDVTVKGAQLQAVREADGQFDVQALFIPEPQPVTENATAAATSSPPSPPSPPWQITLASAQLQTSTLLLEDRATQPSTHWQLTPVNLVLRDIELGSNKPVAVLFDSGINEGARAELHGTLTLAPLSANLDMKLSSFDLNAMQFYVQSVAQLLLRDGQLNVAGHVGYAANGDEPAINFVGNATVQKLSAVDAVRNEDFMRWELLAIKDVAYDSLEERLTIQELALTDPYLRFNIDPDSVTNLSNILTAPAKRRAAAPSATVPAAKVKATPLITINRVRIANGALNFSDQSIKPGFGTGIQHLNGTVRGLSSKELARADVDLKGKVDRYAPVTISGKINPLSDDAFTDLKFDFRGIEMTAFSPYSGKFAGYKIDKGKLNIELRYLLSKKMLQGENKIIIDQLQLGEPVESPDATGLPIRLAIAILQDSNGVIDLDLPVSGRIDDPEFHYGRIVWMALKNIIVKVVTAPFKALMGGNEEEVNQVNFLPGTATLNATELEKLGKLAHALMQRPALLLEIRGTASAADADAIATAALEQRLATQPGQSRQQKINTLYLKIFGEASTTLLPPPVKGETLTPQQLQSEAAKAAETRLLAAMLVSDDELRALAQERAQTISAVLIEGENTVGTERIFLLDVDIKAEPGAAVIVPLSLQVR